MNLSREILHHRHRLSHQQIDQLLGDQKSGEYLAEKLAQMEQLREFFLITDALKEAGIEFICLKGPLLSQRIYGDPTWRSYNDFDFLLESKNLEKGLKLFNTIGYRVCYVEIPKSNCRKEFFFKNLNEIMLHNTHTKVNVELHWRLFSTHIPDELNLEQVIKEHTRLIDLSGKRFKVFSNELELLYLLIHGGGAHSYRRLKWLVDVKDFVETLVFKEEVFLGLVKQFNAIRLVSLTNTILFHFFPQTKGLPGERFGRKSLVTFCLDQIAAEKDEEFRNISVFIKRFWFTMGVFPGWKYKLSVIKKYLLATDSISNKNIPCIPLLYYLIGPFWKLFRGFR